MGMELVAQSDATTGSVQILVHMLLIWYLAFGAIIQVIHAVVLGCVYMFVQHSYMPQAPAKCASMLIGMLVCVVVAAATLTTGIVYLQLDVLMFPGQTWAFPVTVWLTVPSILTPLYFRYFYPMLGMVKCTIQCVVLTFGRIGDIVLMLWIIKGSRKGRVALGITTGLAVLSACGLGYCLIFSVEFLLPKSANQKVC